MFNLLNNNVKKLSIESEYYKEWNESIVKGDNALTSFGKSEDGEIKDFWWDSIKKSDLPWRGGGLITNRGEFAFCVYLKWWAKKDPDILLKRLTSAKTLNAGDAGDSDPKTIYLWMTDSYSPYSAEDGY